MAYTLSTIVDTAGVGPYYMKVIRATADAATQNIETGLEGLVWAGVMPVSMATCSGNSGAVWRAYANSAAAGTATLGTVGISGATSGEIADIICFGYEL